MKTLIHSLPSLVAIPAAVVLVASFAAMASANGYGSPSAGPARDGSSVDASPGKRPARRCHYENYNPNTDLGQGSGRSLTKGKLVCK